MSIHAIEAISPFRGVRDKHRNAPLLVEREQYLEHMLREGVGRAVVRSTPSYLLHITRILNLTELRTIEVQEIQRAGKFWARYRGPYRGNRHMAGSPICFVRIAKAWLHFHGKLALPPEPPFHEQVREFAEAMRVQRGLSPATVLGYSRPRVASRFLFVCTRRPYGPVPSSSLWQIVALPSRRIGIDSAQSGPHSLRHACATRLLQKGTALKEIAEFLGHRDAKSIGIYAKYDVQSLRKVAAFRLAGLR